MDTSRAQVFDLDDIAILELIDTPKPLAIPKLVQLTEHDYFLNVRFKHLVLISLKVVGRMVG